MGIGDLFEKIFGSGGEDNTQSVAMRHVETVEQLDAALATSDDEPVFIFKHSTRCPISSMAHRQVAKYLGHDDARTVFLLHVVESRELSNQVAKRLKVEHQSPQLILVHNGTAIWTTSHNAIAVSAIETAAHQV